MGSTLIQPLTSIKGLGMAAIEQLLLIGPFQQCRRMLFNENITYSKLNKKSLDAFCRGGALDNIVDERFTGRKHFWSACIVDRPKNLKKVGRKSSSFTDPKVTLPKKRLSSSSQS
jgi:DNA polymerase III alpha subunit